MHMRESQEMSYLTSGQVVALVRRHIDPVSIVPGAKVSNAIPIINAFLDFLTLLAGAASGQTRPLRRPQIHSPYHYICSEDCCTEHQCSAKRLDSSDQTVFQEALNCPNCSSQ